MPIFLDKNQVKNMSVEDKQKAKLGLFKGLEWLIMAFELLFLTAYSYNYAFNENNLMFAIQAILFLVLFGIMAFLVLAQQFFYYSFVDAKIHTETKKDDYLYLAGAIIITIIIFFGSFVGGKALFSSENINGYKSQASNDYSKDAKYQATWKQLETAKRELYNNMADCLECKSIEAQYEAKKVVAKKSSRPDWQKTANIEAENRNKEIERTKQMKIAEALSKSNASLIENRKRIQSRVGDLEAQLEAHKQRIDKKDSEEDNKELSKKSQNNKLAGLEAIFTQSLLFIIRYLIMAAYKQENKRIVQTSRFLSLSEALNKYLGNWFKANKIKSELRAKIKEKERISKIANEIAQMEANAGDDYHLIKDVDNVEEAMQILLEEKKKP